MMNYGAEFQARDAVDVVARRRRLSENFVSQVIRDPRTVFDAIWTRLTHDAGHNQQLHILERLEDAIAQAACAPALQQPVFKLELKHTCQASGCGILHCSLCKGNPSRACTQPISPRNLVDTELRSQCGARVETHVVPLRPDTGHILPPFRLQVCVMEKNQCTEAAWHNLSNVALLTYRKTNQEVHRLLCINTKSADAPMGHMHHDNFVYFPTADAKSLGTNSTAGKVTVLPDLILKASGESVVKSKLPDLALAIRAVDLNLQPLDHLIQPVYSNFFQVATKRTKSNMKVDIPFITTEVSKIEGIGAETKSKLSDLANLMGPGYGRIDTVGDLRNLINCVQHDDAEKARLLKALKMNKESWEVVVAHVHKAVEIDNRMRVFTRCVSTRPRRDVGLVFLCDRGCLQATQDGLQGYVERLNGRERFVRWRNLQQKYDVHTYCLASLLEEAQTAWAQPNHPGWDFFRPHGLEVSTEEALPCDGSSPIGVRYPMSPGSAPAYGADGLNLPHYAPPPLDNDGEVELSPRDFPSLGQLTEALRNTPPVPPGAPGASDGERGVLGNVYAGGVPEVGSQPVIDQPLGPPTDDQAFLNELMKPSMFPGTSIFSGTVPEDDELFGNNNSFNAAGQTGAAESAVDVARGITRFTRSFNYTKSGSFRMPDRKRLNHLTSSDLQAAIEAEQPSDLRVLDETPSWQQSGGREAEAGPSNLNDLDGPSDHPGFSQAARCFHTNEERVDEEDLRAKMELQQVSMELYQTVIGPYADSIGGSNPFFPPNEHDSPHNSFRS